MTNHDIDILLLSQAATTVIEDNIFDAVGIGVQNDDISTNVNAVNNFWGDATGPYHASNNPAGLGDDVSDYVDFVPWYTDAAMTATPGAHNVTQDIWYTAIQSAIDYANDGDIIEVSNGIYTEQIAITDIGLTLTGESEAGVIVEADTVPTGAGNVFTINAAGYNITIENMTIRHGDYGIRSSAGNVNVLNCIFYHNGYDGTPLPAPITAVDMSLLWNTNCTNGGAIRIENSAGSEIANCIVYDNDRGIRFQDGANGNIHHNSIHNNFEAGIYLAASSYDGTTGCSNTQVHDNDSYQNYEHGVLSIGGINNTITDNQLYGNWNCGVMLWHPGEIVVQGNTVNNNNLYGFNGIGVSGDDEGGIWAAGAAGAAGSAFDFKILNNTISNNQLGGEPQANGIKLDSQLPGNGIEITDNTLTNHDIDILLLSQAATTVVRCNIFDGSGIGIHNDTSSALDATNNWWGDATGPSGEGGGSGDAVSTNVDFFPWLLSVNCGDSTVVNSDLAVDDDWTGLPDYTQVIAGSTNYYIGLNAFDTIQEAIDIADPCDTIIVNAGTYDEALNIENITNLTISGEDKTTVVLQPSWVLDWNVGGYGASRQVVARNVNSTGVVLENITFDFDVVKANFVFGIMGWDSSVTVDNCVLKNLSVDDLSGGYYELASYFKTSVFSDSNRADVTFTNNTFIDVGRVGIVTHDYINATITDNTFTKTTDDFGYAIEVGSQSTGVVSGNIISGYDTAAATDGSESAGIYIENAFTNGDPAGTKPVLVSDNEVYGCQYAMWIGNGYDGFAGDMDINVTLNDNNFHDNTDGGIILQDEDMEHGSSVTVTGSGNTFSNNGAYGLHIFTQGDGDITVALTGETISGHDIGVMVEDSAGVGSTSSYSIAINQSVISGNTTFGVNNTIDSIIVDATENFWGDASGPSGAGGGSGDAVSTYVDFFPWYINMSGQMTIPVGDIVVDDDWTGLPDWTVVTASSLDYFIGYDAFATIQEAVTAAEAGELISVYGGTYVEQGQIVIDKDLNIAGDPADRPVVKTDQDTSTSGDPRGWWLVDTGVTLNLQYLVLDGAGHNVYQGIRHKGQGTILNVDFVNIKYPSVYSGVAVAAFGTGPVDFVDCDFSEIGRIGVLYFGGGVNTSLFHGNSYTGKGVGDWLDYGVEAGGGAQISVSGCLISDCVGVAASDGSTSAGILVTTYFGPGTEADIRHNRINNCTTAIADGYNETDTAVVTANYNSFMGNDEGVDNTGINTADATYNYWGDPSGPYDPNGVSETDGEICSDVLTIKNSDGLGSSVEDLNVEYCPWLAAPMSTSVYPYLLGDLDFDGDVDIVDFSIYAGNYLKELPAMGGAPLAMGELYLVDDPAQSASRPRATSQCSPDNPL